MQKYSLVVLVVEEVRWAILLGLALRHMQVGKGIHTFSVYSKIPAIVCRSQATSSFFTATDVLAFARSVSSRILSCTGIISMAIISKMLSGLPGLHSSNIDSLTWRGGKDRGRSSKRLMQQSIWEHHATTAWISSSRSFLGLMSLMVW